MKILYVCKSLPHSFQGGIQTHVWKLSEYMLQLGHEVTILTAGSWLKGEKRCEMNGRHIIQIPYLPMRRQPILPFFLEEFSFNAAVNRWISKNVHSNGAHQEGHFDLIHLQGRSGFTFPKNNNETPIITTFHGLIAIENEKSHKSGIQKHLHERWASHFEKNSLKNSDAIIAVSEEMKAEIIEVLPEMGSKISILPNGVDIQKPKPSTPPASLETQPQTLLFVGRLDRIKGIFKLIESLKNVRSDIQLVMIGDGPERQNLEKAIFTEGVSARVNLLGNLPNETVMAWINQCDALILPSFHETQGIVLLEANTCGKPVIASNINGIREVVTHGYNGFLCNPYNPEHIAETINRLFSDAHLMKKIGENGQQRVVEKYDWAIIAEQTETLYKQVLQNFNPIKETQLIENQELVLVKPLKHYHEKA